MASEFNDVPYYWASMPPRKMTFNVLEAFLKTVSLSNADALPSIAMPERALKSTRGIHPKKARGLLKACFTNLKGLLAYYIHFYVPYRLKCSLCRIYYGPNFYITMKFSKLFG